VGQLDIDSLFQPVKQLLVAFLPVKTEQRCAASKAPDCPDLPESEMPARMGNRSSARATPSVTAMSPLNRQG
jgi:hypothetical protein